MLFPPGVFLLPALLLGAAPAPAVPEARPLDCETPAEARAGHSLQLRCTAALALRSVALVLFHRPPGQEEFTPHPALRTGKGRYTVELSACELRPGPLHFFFQVRDADDRVVGHSGDVDNPHLLVVRGGPALAIVPAAMRLPPAGAAVRDEDPLTAARAARQAEREASARAAVREPGSLFVGFGAGYGYGYYPDSQLDFRSDIEIAGNTGTIGLLLLTPEVGYQLSRRFAVGVQLYWQQLRAAGAGDAQMGSPATRSLTVLARGSCYFGGGRTQLVASALIGAGDGFRLVVPPLPEQGLRRNDSVRAGPMVLGPGLGVLFHLHQHAALLFESRLLAGLPRVAAVADARVGVEVAF